ncbi:MAG: ABC transporter ATP-binding protein [Planctomycetota bacterium]
MTPPASSDTAIELIDVAKTYGGRFGKKTPALRGVNMNVKRGEVFGLIGPNGAGKSTLVKILMTVIRPSTCTGSLLGSPIGHKPALARVGYLPEHHAFPGYLTGAQVIDFFGAMAGLSRRERKQRSGALLDLVGMTAWSRRRLRSYSKGMRQRIGIAQALINDPELVLLDEPTDGVDPVGRREIRQIVEQIRDEGRTVLINSHILSELEHLCDRFGLLVKGVMANAGTMDELTEGQRRYYIAVRPESAQGIELDNGTVHVDTEDPNELQPHIDRLRARGVVITGIRSFRPTLEDIFMQTVTNPATGEAYTPGAAKPGEARTDVGDEVNQ